jgi:hypothetical protein
MKHTSGLSITLAAIWVLSGCAILEPRAKEGAPTEVNASEFSEGYALLYDLVSKEKQSSLLSIIKTMSPELKSLLERISETSKATAKELETLVRIDPTRNLKVTHLPRIEQAARDSIDKETPIRLSRARAVRAQCATSPPGDQALELGALHVIAGSGVEIQGYARGDRTSRDRSGRKYSGQRRAVT